MATSKGPGAPIGNKNALKHGLYSSQVDQLSAPNLEDLELTSEVSLLRVLLDRYIQTLPDNFDITILDTISAICLRISSIYKAHSLISGSSQDITDIIRAAIAEVSEDYVR